MEEARVKCEVEEEKQEVLDVQLKNALKRVQELEADATAKQTMHADEIKQLKELHDAKCNENQQANTFHRSSRRDCKASGGNARKKRGRISSSILNCHNLRADLFLAAVMSN